ncbi:MAG: hypothetical protein ACOX0K_10480 [Oscillospiraceae bacterium]|jgi:ribosomal protein L34E
MKIQKRDILYATALMIVFAVLLLLGIRHRILLVPAGAVLVWYLVVTQKRLRCPNCKRTIKLDRLLYAIRRPYSCSECDEPIEVVTKSRP